MLQPRLSTEASGAVRGTFGSSAKTAHRWNSPLPHGTKCAYKWECRERSQAHGTISTPLQREMELFATTLVAIGFLCLVILQLVAIVTSFSSGFGEVLRVFLIPGYALWIACTSERWGKWTLGIGLASLLLGMSLG